MELEDFMRPVDTAVRSAFITARAAARHMIPKRGGAILIFGGSGDPVPDYNIGGFQIGLHALEAMRRQLSSELGRHGVRVGNAAAAAASDKAQTMTRRRSTSAAAH